MQNEIEKIIEDGTFAPSGENCQPWKFAVTGNKISIFNIPEADQSLYNYGQKGSLVAHGALIENIIISSSNYGYEANLELFPKQNVSNLIAIITLEKSSLKEEVLYAYLEKRHTNRKNHKAQKLTQDQKLVLIKTAEETGLGELKIVDDQTSLDILGKAIAVNEEIIFENKELHNFFYEHIIWKEEDQHRARGFYIKTLEFLPHQLKGVRVFKKWLILKILNKIFKVSRMIAKENAEKYSKSGALAIVTVKENNSKDYVNAGRITERVWLKATQLGISVHPCTGVLYFMENLKGGNSSTFSKEHQEAIKTAYSNIVKTFGIEGETIPMLFRLGFADEPSARAMRMKPIISINYD